MYLASRQLSLFQIENWVCSHFLLHFVFGEQDRVHFTANLLNFLKSFCNVSFMISKLQDLIWNLLIQCISSDAKIFWILERKSTSFVLYRLVIISNWLCSFECVLNMCLKKEKKLWHLRLDISCVEDAKKKKYNSAIFPFINDRCCFIVVNIVFHAPWSITCLSHVLILYIVYIWFHLCKKKTQTFHCIYLKISSQNKFVLRHWATANNICLFFYHLNYFLALRGMSSWTIVSKTCWRVKYIVCEQFYLTSMTIIWIEISILWNSMVWLPCYLVWMDFFLPLIYWECELFCLILYIFCTLKYCFHPCAKFW